MISLLKPECVLIFFIFFVYSLYLRPKPLKLKAQSPNWQDFLFITMKVKKWYFRFFICFVFLDRLKAATILKVTLFHGCFHVFQIVQMVTNRAKRLIWKERESRGVLEIRDGEDLWRWPWLEISLNAFRRSAIPQKQFIIKPRIKNKEIWLKNHIQL